MTSKLYLTKHSSSRVYYIGWFEGNRRNWRTTKCTTKSDALQFLRTFEVKLGVYRLRLGESITDEGKVFYIYPNNKFWLNLYPSNTKRVFAGRDEDDYYIFQFEGKDVTLFKRKHDI